MGERLAKSMTMYGASHDGPIDQNNSQVNLMNNNSSISFDRNDHKSSASAIRRGARMSLDMTRDNQLQNMKLDARRTSMESLPQRSSIFKMNNEAQTVNRKSLEPHKFDPMARTQIQFGSLKPNADFGSITIQSRPLIPQKKNLKMHNFGSTGSE